MSSQPLATMTVTDMGDGGEVIVTGDDGTGDIGTKEALLVLSRAVATVIKTSWDKSDWPLAVRAAHAMITEHVLDGGHR